MSKYISLFGLMVLASCASDTRRSAGASDPSAQEVAAMEKYGDETADAVGATAPDQAFFIEAASGGMFEVQSSELVLSQRESDETTDFAQTMIRDHTQANERLKALAEAKSVVLSDEMLPDHARELEVLRAVQGEDTFTAAYQRAQDQAHREAISLFQRCAASCQDPDVRQFASESLPTLQAHLSHLEQLEATARR